MGINTWREKIDQLDEEIVRLINERASAARAIGDLKRTSELPVYEPGRERDVMAHVSACNAGPLTEAEIVDIYQRIMDVMRTLQRRDR